MNVYFVMNWDDAVVEVHGTRNTITEAIKKRPEKPDDLRVELWDVPTDKAALLNIISLASCPGDPYHPREHPNTRLINAWEVTARGGLKEVKE